MPRLLSPLVLIVSIALIGALPLAGCREENAPALPASALRGPRAPQHAHLFLQYPLLDQRIVRLDPRQPAQRQRYYPDRWQRDARAVRDFAVDAQHLYVLLARWGARDDARLYVVRRKNGTLLRTISVPPQPALLRWVAPQTLALCHATPATGPAGRLVLLDSKQLTVRREIALDGACQAVVGAADRVFVLVRSERRLGPRETVFVHHVVAVDAAKGERRLARLLPAGARELVLGPNGLLYIAFASGSGRHATDGTVGVYEPEQLSLVDRLRPQMLVRGIMAAGQGASGLLLLGMLHESEAWLSAVRADDSSAFDLRFGRLTGAEAVVIDDVAYFSVRGEHTLERISLPRGERLPRLQLGALPQGSDPIGMLRTALTFAAPQATSGR